MLVQPISPRSAAAIRQIVDKGDAAYGINTGFGKLAKTRIPDDQLELLQRNLILSHSVGVGEPMSDATVRLVMVSTRSAPIHPAIAAPSTSTRWIDGSWLAMWRAVARADDTTVSGVTGAPIFVRRVTTTRCASRSFSRA